MPSGSGWFGSELVLSDAHTKPSSFLYPRPLPFVTCGVSAFVARLGLHSVSSAVKVAVAVWVIAPLPWILANAAFMKLH
jgi:hypothetical protein